MRQIAFIIVSLMSLLLLNYGTGRNKKLLLFFISWQAVVGTLAILKIFEKQPNLFPLLIIGTVALVFISLKQIDKQKLNPEMLLAIHILRIPVELILFQLYLMQKIPIIMTFKGWNLDILIGLSALVILIFRLIRKRKINIQFLKIWNFVGIAFLFIIVSLAILSSPLPVQQFAFEQPNIAVLEFPYCFLPTCVVPIVLISHLLLINGQIKAPPPTGYRHK
ncbi:hypothetical protein [Pedobacter sandarakinus]|uniref:hypothetical protein n=1 Tax=Pedobacter sandarakinus TaxID=353156 RepID=UPI002247B850|nr:hypothetical protein [Pedobacter sandarakinus]MCX2575372.1 hypothetical protein [Pedobacter sandarakinus]